MGTFAGYYGDRSVPSELREEFSTRVLTILREGGMMRIECQSICMISQSICFLR